jgi:hypothetical protein
MSRRRKEKTSRSKKKAAKNAPKSKSKSRSKPVPKREAPRESTLSRSPSQETADSPAAEGEGARQLVSAVNTLVGKNFAEIAQTLVEKTVAGSASHARLIVGLSGAGGLAPSAPRRGRAATTRDSAHALLTAADLPGSEENWEFDIEPEARPGYIPPTKP